MPPISPPPPTATSTVSSSGACSSSSRRDRALAEERLDLVEGMDVHARRLARPASAGGERVGVALAAHDEFGAVARMRSIFAGDDTSGT